MLALFRLGWRVYTPARECGGMGLACLRADGARLLPSLRCSGARRLCQPLCGESTQMDRTFVMFKPDCMERGLFGSILSRFERKGLRLVALKMMRITPDLAKQHYAEHVEKPFYPGLEEFITASPVVATVMEGPEVVRVVRDMLGATSGLKAAPGTIRGDHSASRQMNLVHASDSPESAAREIDLYFKADEIQQWDPTLACWLQAPDD
jgi:nucleoside-diphosphate kinase